MSMATAVTPPSDAAREVSCSGVRIQFDRTMEGSPGPDLQLEREGNIQALLGRAERGRGLRSCRKGAGVGHHLGHSLIQIPPVGAATHAQNRSSRSAHGPAHFGLAGGLVEVPLKRSSMLRDQFLHSTDVVGLELEVMDAEVVSHVLNRCCARERDHAHL